ncbi:MAG TPA: hypothetical protein VGD21_03980 [Lysobacter sp.]
MSMRLIATAVMAGLLACLPAVAATYKVDDSASQVLGNNVRMKWDTVVPQAGRRSTVSGELTVLVRLNVSQWQGRQGRIYMTLPAQPTGPVSATWTTQGRLLPGVLRAGERTLVYTGPIQSGLIEDTVRLLIQADGQKLVRPEQLTFSFEIDLETP